MDAMVALGGDDEKEVSLLEHVKVLARHFFSQTACDSSNNILNYTMWRVY